MSVSRDITYSIRYGRLYALELPSAGTSSHRSVTSASMPGSHFVTFRSAFHHSSAAVSSAACRYSDRNYEYRHVILPQEIAKQVRNRRQIGIFRSEAPPGIPARTPRIAGTSFLQSTRWRCRSFPSHMVTLSDNATRHCRPPSSI